MRLLYAPPSAYSRKVRIVAREKQLDGLIEEVLCNPYDDPANLLRANALGKIPALELDGGTTLYDSPVICEYLDSLNDAPRLIPAAGPTRWQVLTAQALADGLLDAAVQIAQEKRRPETEQSPAAITRRHEVIDRALQTMTGAIAALPPSINLGGIACACALGYLDFRQSERNWRAAQPALAHWYAAFSQRPSMLATEPR
jgi:glutathione S-transferase